MTEDKQEQHQSNDDARETNVNHGPKRPRGAAARTHKAKVERLSVSQIAVKRAKVRNIDASRAAKEVRSRLRSNFDTVCKLDPTVSKVKSAANDGNRWPALNMKVVEELGLIRRVKS
jgi:hypothetical protein